MWKNSEQSLIAFIIFQHASVVQQCCQLSYENYDHAVSEQSYYYKYEWLEAVKQEGSDVAY